MVLPIKGELHRLYTSKSVYMFAGQGEYYCILCEKTCILWLQRKLRKFDLIESSDVT